MRGAVGMLVFLILLMLAFWLMNVYKHIRSGLWSRGQKIMDLIGTVLLLAALIAVLLPILRFGSGV